METRGADQLKTQQSNEKCTSANVALQYQGMLAVQGHIIVMPLDLMEQVRK